MGWRRVRGVQRGRAGARRLFALFAAATLCPTVLSARRSTSWQRTVAAAGARERLRSQAASAAFEARRASETAIARNVKAVVAGGGAVSASDGIATVVGASLEGSDAVETVARSASFASAGGGDSAGRVTAPTTVVVRPDAGKVAARELAFASRADVAVASLAPNASAAAVEVRSRWQSTSQRAMDSGRRVAKLMLGGLLATGAEAFVRPRNPRRPSAGPSEGSEGVRGGRHNGEPLLDALVSGPDFQREESPAKTREEPLRAGVEELERGATLSTEAIVDRLLNGYKVIMGPEGYRMSFTMREPRLVGNYNDELVYRCELLEVNEPAIAKVVELRESSRQDDIDRIQHKIDVMKRFQGRGGFSKFYAYEELIFNGRIFGMILQEGADKTLREFLSEMAVSREAPRNPLTDVWISCRLFLPILHAIEKIQDEGFVYGPMKLDDIVVHLGNLKLASFRFCCHDGSHEPSDHQEWDPPEVQVTGKYTKAGDTWFAGVLLYEMIFGERPSGEAPYIANDERFHYLTVTSLPLARMLQDMIQVPPSLRPSIKLARTRLAQLAGVVPQLTVLPIPYPLAAETGTIGEVGVGNPVSAPIENLINAWGGGTWALPAALGAIAAADAGGVGGASGVLPAPSMAPTPPLPKPVLESAEVPNFVARVARKGAASVKMPPPVASPLPAKTQEGLPAPTPAPAVGRPPAVDMDAWPDGLTGEWREKLMDWHLVRRGADGETYYKCRLALENTVSVIVEVTELVTEEDYFFADREVFAMRRFGGREGIVAFYGTAQIQHANGRVYSVVVREAGERTLEDLMLHWFEGMAEFQRLKCLEDTRFYERVRYIVPILRALELIQRDGYVVGDFSPTDIVVDGDKAKLSNFRFACNYIGGDCRNPRLPRSRRWLQPEVELKKTLSYRSDTWAAGVLLYQLIFGALPQSEGIVVNDARFLAVAAHRPAVGALLEDMLCTSRAKRLTIPKALDRVEALMPGTARRAGPVLDYRMLPREASHRLWRGLDRVRRWWRKD